MRVMRGLVFGAVSVLPAFFVGMVVYVLIGGDTDFPEWDTWMYGPCYLLPALIVGGSLLLGLRDEEDAQ